MKRFIIGASSFALISTVLCSTLDVGAVGKETLKSEIFDMCKTYNVSFYYKSPLAALFS